MAESTKNIDLGFAEECDPEAITNRYFPSKIGGKPAWLELKNLPTAEQIKCPNCNEPRLFLGQIYAPIESREDCFHRTIFVFICRKDQCQKQNSAENIVIFRSQLPRQNDYYSSEPPGENEILPAVPPLVKLCFVCGCHGPLLCSKCKNVSYCGAAHQKIDWRTHKTICIGGSQQKIKGPATASILFPEFEIVIEPEPEAPVESKNETEEEAEERRKKEYEELQKSGQTGKLTDVSDSELAKYSTIEKDDRLFGKFKKQINPNPDQILRYVRGGNPLWITSKNVPDKKDVPNCASCGSERIFEFQIMPQLLHVIKEEVLDWGVIAVYTCQQSCDTKSGYLKEFAVKQDISSNEEGLLSSS